MQSWNFENIKKVWDIIEWEKIIEIKKYKKSCKLNNFLQKAPFISIYESDLYITKKNKYYDSNREKLIEIREREDILINKDILIKEATFIKNNYKNIKFIGENIKIFNN